MTQKTIKIIKAPSSEAVYAASLMLHKLPVWRQALKPLFDAAANDIKAQEKIALHVPKALDEFGRYCQTLGKEIKAAQAERAQQAVAPLPATKSQPATKRQPAAELTRQIGPRREGTPPSSSPRPVGRPRKPARRQ